MTDIMNYVKYKMSHVQAEIEYLRTTVEEQKAIIKQLTEGPGEVTYIHPFDLFELVNNLPVSECCALDYLVDAGDCRIGGYYGKVYRQSVLIPSKSKNIK